MLRHRDSQLGECDTFDATEEDYEPEDVFVPDPWAEALIACFDYMRNRPSPGAVYLYAQVNLAWCFFTAKRCPW